MSLPPEGGKSHPWDILLVLTVQLGLFSHPFYPFTRPLLLLASEALEGSRSSLSVSNPRPWLSTAVESAPSTC